MVILTPISPVTHYPYLTALMTQGGTCCLHLKASCYAWDPSHTQKASSNSRVIFPLLLQQDGVDLGYKLGGRGCRGMPWSGNMVAVLAAPHLL